MLAELKAAELPLAVPKVPALAKTVDGEFVFHFRSNSPLETGIAIADYRPTGIEVWSPLKVPIVLQSDVANKYGMTVDQVKVHVITGGGSFGRHLFSDAALEAVEASHAFGKPVKLMWSRTDDFRQGRTHPMATSRVRATYLAGNVLTYEQRHTSVSTDFSHGLGEMISAFADRLPEGQLHGGARHLRAHRERLVQLRRRPTSCSTRSTWASPPAACATSTHRTCAPRRSSSPTSSRSCTARTRTRSAASSSRTRAGSRCSTRWRKVGNWGRRMPAGTAQGIAVHNEYKGWSACLVEIDTPAVDRAPQGRERPSPGPRVTKVVFAVDVGKTLNPRGLEAQMQGGIMDGIAQALTSSLHLQRRLLPRSQLGQLLLHARVERAP